MKIYWGEKYTDDGEEKRWSAIPLSYWIQNAKSINNLKEGFYIKNIPSCGELATKTILRFIRLNNWKLLVTTKSFENFVSYVLMTYQTKFYYLREDIQELILNKHRFKEYIYVYKNSSGVETITAPHKKGYCSSGYYGNEEIDLKKAHQETEIFNSLLTAEDLAKKLRGLMTLEDIKFYAEHNWMPHYSYGAETTAFNFKEVTTWMRNNLYKHEGKTLPINYVRLKHTPIAKNIITNPPEEIKNESDLIQVPAGYPPGVYFLCQDKDIVYVGQTGNLGSRLAQHLQDKVFDNVYFIPTENCGQVEADYIRKLKPKYNKVLYNQGAY
jgi:hypothetical protein